MLSLLTLFKDLVVSVSAGFVKYFFNSELGGAEKSLGFNLVNFIKDGAERSLENLIIDGREERLKQVRRSLLCVCKKTYVRRSKRVA